MVLSIVVVWIKCCSQCSTQSQLKWSKGTLKILVVSDRSRLGIFNSYTDRQIYSYIMLTDQSSTCAQTRPIAITCPQPDLYTSNQWEMIWRRLWMPSEEAGGVGEEEGGGGARLGAVIDSRRPPPIGQQAGKWNQGHGLEGEREERGRKEWVGQGMHLT